MMTSHLASDTCLIACGINLVRHADKPKLGTPFVKVHNSTNTLDTLDLVHIHP